MNQRFYVIIMSHIKKIQTNGEGGLVAIVRDMTNEHELEQVKKTLSQVSLTNCAHRFHYYKVIPSRSWMVSSLNRKKSMNF